MRNLRAILIVVLAAAFPAQAAAPDGINLSVSRGPGPAAVSLAWTGSIPTYTVFRSTNPATATSPGNSLGDTSANSWVDTPPAGRVFYYVVVGRCPAGQVACGGVCAPDTDADTYCDGQDNCPAVANSDQADLDRDEVGNVCDNCPAVANSDQANGDGDSAGNVCDYCASDPQKVDRGRCGCFKVENTGDDDGDGAINCQDQCPGSNDALDADRGGLPDACDPCPTGLCSLTLPDRFYVELPGHQALRVSRDGRWIAALELSTNRGVLIPTEELIRNPSDVSYYEYMGTERVVDIRAFSDDNNLVLANVRTHVPNAASEVNAAAIYDRPNGRWTVLGLYDDAIDVDACRFYNDGADMTSDGKVIYGRTPTVEYPCKYVGSRYDVGADAWQLFGGPEGEVRLVEGASGDGGRIAGSENRAPYFDEFGNPKGGAEYGVIWTFQPSGEYSSQWMDDYGVAYDVTFDGSAAAVSSAGLAHRWTATGGLARLGPGTLDASFSAQPIAISDTGSLITGYHVRGLAVQLPFMWTQGVGFGPLYNYLLWRGFTPSQLGHFSTNFIPEDLSGNGRIIVGSTSYLSGLPGWVAITLN